MTQDIPTTTPDLLEEIIAAGDALSFAAQTTGGTAGPDAGLQNAIARWQAVAHPAFGLPALDMTPQEYRALQRRSANGK
jgi:hypothetical protein